MFADRLDKALYCLQCGARPSDTAPIDEAVGGKGNRMTGAQRRRNPMLPVYKECYTDPATMDILRRRP